MAEGDAARLERIRGEINERRVKAGAAKRELEIVELELADLKRQIKEEFDLDVDDVEAVLAQLKMDVERGILELERELEIQSNGTTNG